MKRYKRSKSIGITFTSSQDGGIGRHTLPPRITKTRTTTNLKTKTQRELTENQTVWKSDNQGIKEETFIQTGRRGGDGQLCREDSQQGSGWWTGRGGGLQTGQSHIHVQINQEEQLGSENHHTTQSFSVGK